MMDKFIVVELTCPSSSSIGLVKTGEEKIGWS